MRTLSKSALTVFGGLAATTLLKRGMRSALASAAGESDGPSSTLGTLASLLKGETVEDASHLEHFARFAYGAGWLAMVALAGSKIAVKNAPFALVGGAVLGAAVWTAGEIGKASERRRHPRSRATMAKEGATSFAEHVLYGTAALAPVAARSYLRNESAFA